jgi:tetratricopeptide (TPR) repeat protein
MDLPYLRTLRIGVVLAAVVGVCATAVTFTPSTTGPLAFAQDTAVAKSLFDSGKQALSKKRYDEAVRFFRKALDESDDLIEAAYWEAQAHEKLKRSSAALAAYRNYLVLYEEKQALSEVSKAETALVAKSEKRVDKLAAGERALDALQQTFVDELMKFAVAHEEDDPSVARDALTGILTIDPEHPDARRRWEALDGGGDDTSVGPAPKAPPGPFARLKKKPWHDLIERKSLGTKTATYQGDSMFVDLEGGSVMRPTERIRTGDRYLVEIDFRVLKEHQRTWLVGIVVGWAGEDFYTAFAQRSQVVLNRGNANSGQQEDVESHPMKPIDPARWHRLSVRIEGRAMVVWFDGDVVCRTEVEDAKSLQGEIGLFTQRCKVEYRLVRSAEME